MAKEIKPKDENLANSLIQETGGNTPTDPETINPENSGDVITSNPKKIEDEDYEMPEYLKENPPANQEEIDAIGKFLQDYRSGKTSGTGKDEPGEDLEKTYGPGYVQVENESGSTKYFSKNAWERIGGHKNQDGWKVKVKTPPEVEALKKA